MTGPVRICPDEAGFREAVAGWRPGLPFPVLAGPQLDRYRALFGAAGLPAVAVEDRPGTVLSAGGPLGAACGRLLAAATGRPHRHVPADRLRPELSRCPGQLVAVVGLAAELDAVEDWPGSTGALVGVLTARSAAALACLVYRSVTVGAAAPADDDRVFVASHPLLPGAADADAVDAAGLAHVRRRRVRALVLRMQGRECSAGVLDTMICGRNDSPRTPLPLAPGLRATPCVHGAGCFRTDLADEDLLPAQDVRATLVFTHSCSSIAVGTNAYPHRISLGLGLLEGTAVAVVGALGVHVAQRSSQWELEHSLARRLPLGEVTDRLARHATPLSGDMVRYGLLGDPGLVLPWTGRTRSTAGPVPAAGRPRLDPAALDGLRGVAATLTRLLRLRWLDVPVGEDELAALRERVRAVSARPLEPDAAGQVATLADDVAGLQERVVAELVNGIWERGWDFAATATTGLRQEDRWDVRCPGCGLPRAAVIALRHAVEPELTVRSLQCRRCGEAWWTTEPGEPTLLLRGPVDLAGRRGGTVPLRRSLTNLGPVERRGAVGHGFKARRYLGLPPPRWTPCRVGAGQTVTVGGVVDLAGSAAAPDTHTTPVVAVLDGFYLASMVMLRLT